MKAEIIPAFILIDYIWVVLKKNTDMQESDYDGLVPIVPLSEAPEFTQYAKPYIVYGYSDTPSSDLWVRRQGNMAFVIYADNFQQLSKITNIMAYTFDRADETAKDVNDYTSTIPAYYGLTFGYIQVSFVEGGSPEETEGGRISSAVNIKYEYHVDYDVDTSAL